VSKYKYYFRKPKSEIVKDVLLWLAVASAISVAASSPHFISNVVKKFKKGDAYKKRRVYDAFYTLMKQGCINFKTVNRQIFISLTEKGRERAGKFQIDDLKINKPEKWDSKWRIIIFDISQIQRLKRNAFRGKIKELGFYPLQKSVWIYPYQCKDEIELLRDFFGLTEKDIRLIISENIGNDNFLKKIFKLN
jgi:DNA-binding transcriptional regulator PaaX